MLTKQQEEMAIAAGRFDFLQKYIQIKLDIYTDSLKLTEDQMKAALEDHSQHLMVKFYKNIINEYKLKIELLKDLQIK